NIPGILLGPDIGTDCLESGAGQRHVLHSEVEPQRYRKLRRIDKSVDCGLDRHQRAAPGRIRKFHYAVQINLSCGELRVDLRGPTKHHVGLAAKTNRTMIIRTILEFNLFQPGCRHSTFDMRHHPPGFYDAVRGASHRSRELERAFETWTAFLEKHKGVGIGDQGLIDRFDVEPYPDAPF